MIFYSKRSPNCLFCNKGCEAPLQVVQEETVENALSQPPTGSATQEEDGDGHQKAAEKLDCSCHKSPIPFLGPLSWNQEESDGFHNNLKYAFLLRQLLDYPKSKCVQYLKQRWKMERGGVPDDKQDGWFTVCGSCSKLVEEGHETYHKIEELERKLCELKKNMKEMLVSSHGGYLDSLTENEKDSENGDDTICSEVRNHFVPRVPVDQAIVKMEVDIQCQTELLETNADFINEDEDDDPMDGGNTSESDWAPSEEIDDNDPLDIKPDLIKLMASKDLPHETPENEEEETNTEASLIQLKQKDDIEPLSTIPQRTLRSRKSARLTLKVQDQDQEAEVVTPADESEEEEDESVSTIKKKKKKSVLSDSESESMSEEESGSEDQDNVNSKGQFSCSICGVIYQTQHRCREHEDLHKRDDVFKCKKCQFVCLTNRGLKIHNTKLHITSDPSAKLKVKKKKVTLEYATDGEDGNDYSCDMCPVVYKTVHRLREHQEKHQMENVHRCQVCGFVCLKSRGIRIHARKYHSNLANWNEIFDEDVKSNEAASGTTDAAEQEYSCTICCAVYKTKHRLNEHKRFHKMDNAVKCPDCPYVCMTERQLFVHSNKQHPKSDDPTSSNSKTCAKKNSSGPYHCVLCPAKYQTENRFKQHSALHNSDVSFKCELCGWVLSTQEKLQHHLIFSHKKKRAKRLRSKEMYKCDHCPTLFGSRQAFRDHVFAYHKGKLVQCKECDRCFESKQLLNLHVQKKACDAVDTPTAESDDDALTAKTFNCRECCSAFKSRSQLRAHIAAAHIKEFPCTVCSATFPTESRYKFHMSRMHDKIHNVCRVCNYKAHGASHLRLHMQKHTKQKMYMCEICSKTFTSPTYLTGHKQKEHFQELGVQPIKCEECNVLLPSRAQLKYHNQKVHEKKFKYFCEQCGKGFLFESGLKNHSQIHSTERNEVCKICGAAYVHNRVLMDHMKNHHPEVYAASKGKDPTEVSLPKPDQGPFVCKFCNQEFSMRYHLHSHLKTHTEVYDKYKCSVCGRGYSSVSGLKRHEESAHQSSTYDCPNCGRQFPCRDYVRYHVKNHCRKKEGTAEKSEDPEDTKHETVPTEPIILNKAGQLHVVTPSASAAVDTSTEFVLAPHHSATVQQVQVPSSSYTQQDSLVNDFTNPFLRSYYQTNYK